MTSTAASTAAIGHVRCAPIDARDGVNAGMCQCTPEPRARDAVTSELSP